MSRPLDGVRVLIVEDETIIAMTAEDMIEDMGGIVAGTAASLAEALAVAPRDDFDVAMLDINLNGEMSLPIADMLVAARRPFVFTTGYGSAGPGDRFAGIPVLKKPYDADALARAISELIQLG